MATVFYIHGAFATPASFQFIHDNLPVHKIHTLSYSVNENLHFKLNEFSDIMKSCNEPFSIVGHSLGGILAVLLAHRNKTMVEKVMSISSPFGGSQAANILKWFSPHKLYSYISTNSTLLKGLHANPLTFPVRSLVTTKGGNPLMIEENDGVVTTQSQLALAGAQYIKVEYNHFEVLMAPETIKLMKEFLF